uniref:Ras-associating domain-containing protein n=1 Tax=Gouania willdenowi TaxID=441366 RepID=A0A8C5GXZ7_GOUWI
MKISVWVCREEKLVLGLSKRTTCADVVQVLLEDQNSEHGLSVSQSYCIVEKWRGFERILPNQTKIFRLWLAWAEQQKNVKFVLVKSDASLESHGARSAESCRFTMRKKILPLTADSPDVGTLRGVIIR